MDRVKGRKIVSTDKIIIKGAREHNLKNVSIEIPRDSLVVITGVSGSGKSSLAFDTLYAEGQRRYVESLSAYARQFLEQMDKPDVDSIGGLYRGTLAGNIYRAEEGQPKSPLHGRNCYRDLRLPASSLCKSWNTLLLSMRRQDRRPVLSTDN